jgi:hypothetical protein
MKIKASELEGVALDWAVAKCEAHPNISGLHPDGGVRIISGARFNPSRLWADGGPIIEREGISLKYLVTADTPHRWLAKPKPTIICPKPKGIYGSTALIAAMRCYVASKMGDEIEILDELMRNL